MYSLQQYNLQFHTDSLSIVLLSHGQENVTVVDGISLQILTPFTLPVLICRKNRISVMRDNFISFLGNPRKLYMYKYLDFLSYLCRQ